RSLLNKALRHKAQVWKHDNCYPGDRLLSGSCSKRSRERSRRAKKEEIIRVPPPDRRLHHAMDREHEEHCLRGSVEPGKPEKRSEQIPLRDINLIAAAKTEHQHRPGNNQRISDKKDDRGIRRKLEPVVAGAVAHENYDYANHQTDVPKPNASDDDLLVPHGSPSQSRHQPDRRSPAP